MTEIKDYENYLIFEDGVIINIKKQTELKPWITIQGYYRVGLSKNGKTKQYFLHRLIAETFIPNIDNKLTVDHINRNKEDNRIENLRWANQLEQNNNRNLYTNTGFHFIYKIVRNDNKQGFTYVFKIQRPQLNFYKSCVNLDKIIEFRNKFCAENDIEINDK